MVATMKKSKELWVGLVDAEQRPGIHFLGEKSGGYVNVVASASSYRGFERKIARALNELGLNLVEIEDPMTLAHRLETGSVGEEILTMAETVRQIDSVAFGTFFVYDRDE